MWLIQALLVSGTLQRPVFAQQAPAVPSPAHIEEVLRSANSGHSLEQVAISPDGKRLAWIEDGKILVATLDKLDSSQRVTARGENSTDWDCAEHDLA